MTISLKVGGALRLMFILEKYITTEEYHHP
jgi:hypothetical protein